jgi:hypothetical protein
MKPFYFYGGYVALNAQDKAELAKSETLRYYICTVKEVSDQNK